ncbi:uncharacterized [Tachysurus ichikawai]
MPDTPPRPCSLPLLHSDPQLSRRVEMKSLLTKRTLPVFPCQGQNAVDLLAATQHAKLCAAERKGLRAKAGKKEWRGRVKEEEEMCCSLRDAVASNARSFLSRHLHIL